jgi:Raf kinase inhibitor-like YbhB/YbcL family protein
MTKPAVLAFLLVAACGGGDGDDGDDADDAPAIDAPPGAIDAPPDETDSQPAAFTLTSPAFAEGGVIPDENSCAGANTSPQLDWTGAPAGTLSFAVVFTDITPPPLIHSVIYDIPGTATGLPADVEKVYAPTDVPGAHQTTAYSPTVRGYLGPCPGSMHTYQFELFALDVPTLPGATMGTTRSQAVALIDMHTLGSATLTGTFTP